LARVFWASGRGRGEWIQGMPVRGWCQCGKDGWVVDGVEKWGAGHPDRRRLRRSRLNSLAKKLQTPEFKSDAEEARWYEKNQDSLLTEFKDAAKDGTLRRGSLAKRGLTPTTTIRLDKRDIELAKQQAEQRRLRYQTYLKMLIHQALKEEGSRVGR
jgi:predicted DNA binding CopG/RHH family protein